MKLYHSSWFINSQCSRKDPDQRESSFNCTDQYYRRQEIPPLNPIVNFTRSKHNSVMISSAKYRVFFILLFPLSWHFNVLRLRILWW